MNDLSRPRRYGLWLVLALIIFGGGYYWSKHAKKTDAVTMDKAQVTRGNLTETIASTGTLSAMDEVTVGSQVSGIITKVLVDFNDHVKKNQLLALVDPKTLQAQVDSSRATLAQRQVAYDEAVRQLDEGKRLYAEKYLAERDLRALEVAVRSTKAQLDSANVDFNKQSVQLAYSEIRSPIDGVIMSRTVDPGNTVQSSMQAPTLFVVGSDLRHMKILANVDETQITQIKEGMTARFTVTSINNKVFNAKVRQIRLKPTTSNNVVTYTVVLDADNSEQLLFPGMTATIDFILSNIENALLVPSAALRVRVPESVKAVTAQSQSSQSSGSAPVASGARQAGQGAQPWNGNANGAWNGGAAGQRPGGRPGVWMLNAEGKAYRVPVRVLGSDLTNTAVQPQHDGELKEGDEVLIKVVDTSSSSSAAAGATGSRNMMPGVGGFPAGGR